MIPSITSFTSLSNGGATVVPGATDIGNTALPLVPVFMLGGSAPVPIQTPPLQLAEQDALPESSDPEQLLQLLLDPALTAPITLPQPLPPTQSQPQFNAALSLPARVQVSRATTTAMPANMQASTLDDLVTTPSESVPVQPFRLRTPQDAREASQQVLTMMQAQPEESLAKMPSSQIVAQAQPLIAVNQASVNATAKTQVPLALPEGAQEKAAALREALGERLQMQVDQRSQKATIRLDPPNLGKLDISLHYEGGKLQVQIQAAQPEVYRALQQVSQELRGALSEQNQVAVNVQVSQQQQQQGDQRHAPHQQPAQDAVLSNHIAEVTEEQRHRDLSILTTV